MKYDLFSVVSIAVLSTMGFSEPAASTAYAEAGLLIIAHGARTDEWNAPVLEFGRKVADEAMKGGRFRAVRTAMLEASQPDVRTAVVELEAEGCDRIIAVPLFVAPSGHSHFDVPAALGIYSSPAIRAVIAEEGGAITEPKVPVTLTQTLDGGEILCTFALDQVRKLSENPSEEALVLIAHGDPNHHRLVDSLMRRIATYCCGRAGIDYGDWAFVEMGQSYLSDGVAAITRASEHKKRVLVVGIYVSSTGLSIHKRAMAGAQGRFPRVSEFFEEKDVVFSEQALVTHPATVRWVLETANHVLKPLCDTRD